MQVCGAACRLPIALWQYAVVARDTANPSESCCARVRGCLLQNSSPFNAAVGSRWCMYQAALCDSVQGRPSPWCRV